MTVPISLTLFALHYRFSFPCRHQNLINFEFLHKHKYLYLSLFLSCRNMELVSFYGDKLWLRDDKDIFAIFQSVVYRGFLCRSPSPYVIMATMKYPFSDIFSHRLLKPIFFLVVSQGILHTFKSSWNILVLLGCMQGLAMFAATHYSFLCLHPAFLPILRLEGQGAKCCKRTCFQGFLVKRDPCIIHEETLPAVKCMWADLWSSEEPHCSQGDSVQVSEAAQADWTADWRGLLSLLIMFQ